MKLFNKTHLILSSITFTILFLMNYLGSDASDRISRALLNAVAGVVGLSIGMFILYKNKDDKNPPDRFD
ncbi:hypothetical protein [Planobacterium oryzisoli]|uniref:Uncharacterized protein n=1 Tax=Planobacterium oryzisoli TaxID=2771435 RepID=A0A930YUH9_9FLAO|nr:hypothetical protein [Planobacterium oryzisoli]MBF5026595.1 hypothetical protein [Planobacterium oryzisoli]